MDNRHSSKADFQKQYNIKHMTNQQLKHLLSKLEEDHDKLEATNQELTNQISDLRNAVKCVQSQRRENIAYQIQKKKELQNKIDSLQKGLKYASQNNSTKSMEQYKAIME